MVHKSIFTQASAPPPPPAILSSREERRTEEEPSQDFDVRCGYVVSASGCCTAVSGSDPARHPSLGSAQENPGEEKQRCRFFPAQQQEIPAQHQACQPVTKDEYCINTVERKLQK
jgi:hypothetical protein